jgi:endo-1,3(4)-beta-glucanase
VIARRPVATAAVLFLVAMLVTACVGGHRDGPHRGQPHRGGPTGSGTADPPTEAAGRSPIAEPRPGGKGSFAPDVPAGQAPTRTPAQAGPDLAGQALPTNQWWTSALTGPLSQPMWARPLAVRAAADGLAVSSAAPVASANSVITPFQPAVTAGGPIDELRVTGYGAFHVVVRARLRGGSTVEATVVQGSPLLYLRFDGGEPTVRVAGAGTGTGAGGAGSGAEDATVDGTTVHLNVAGQPWELRSTGGTWRRDGDRFTATGTRDGQIAVARVPDSVDRDAWRAAVADAAADPVVETTATMAYDQAAGTVTQTLTARRTSGRPSVWALLPHQRAGLVRDGTTELAGAYPDALGSLHLVRAGAVRVRVPMPGLLTGAPSVPLSDSARTALTADLNADLSGAPPAAGATGGSYFGAKELGRLATIAQVAGSVGATAERRQALDRLRPQLVDWLTYRGSGDQRYFAYDRGWGGLIAVPAEFGSNDYNDHHLQYGYLVRAAAELAAADPGFRRDYGGAVDAIVADYTGGAAGFPTFRVFNPYLGHSAASGFAPFADGNNQESSSEAVAAWEAVVRWGLVRNRPDLVLYGVTHDAMESATARMYWLGQGLDRPAGYAHTVAGIVWDAKLDYATFFDPKPESVEGIQLLPLTFGSLYRADRDAAAARGARLDRAIGGAPRVWGDLFAADRAAADPTAALDRLRAGPPREDSTSRAMVRAYVELLAAFGPPQPAVTADGPYGLAFGSAEHPTLAAVNPTGERRTVTFRRGGRQLAAIVVEPGGAVSRTI